MIYDTDLHKILLYLKSIDPSLTDRMQICEKYYIHFHEKTKFEQGINEKKFCVYLDDLIAWYIYHINLYTYEPYNSGLNLCSRIVPIFKSFGNNLEILSEVINFEERIKRILKTKDNSVDNLLCEIAVALGYSRYKKFKVEFLTETQSKTPDIKVTYKGKEHFVEVKRKIKNSEYHNQERNEWARLAKPLNKYLRTYRIMLTFRITFHDELKNYYNDYLLEVIKKNIIDNRVSYYSDEKVDLRTQAIDLVSINNLLKENSQRNDTTQIMNWLFGYDFERDNAISYTLLSKSGKHPFYIDEVSFANALIWKCDSENAIENHAKSLKKLLVKAVKQIPNDQRGSIHFIIESYQGDAVEDRIFQKLNTTLWDFTINDKHVDYIYLHYWKFRIPPDQNWLLDQDCVIWDTQFSDRTFLLEKCHLLNVD